MSSRYVSRAAQEAEHALRDIQSRIEGNQYCADCGTTRPEYINLTIGTFICDLCADIHRSSSNRRIKDMFGGDITMEDVRRMDTVGNDVANRKFLATWNPREVPEPDRRDKDALREFLWLKYEGSFKKIPTPSLPPAQQVSESSRYYDSRRDDRARERDTSYGREQQLFREPQRAPDRSRSYWSTRFGEAARPQLASPPAPSRHDDYYRRGEGLGEPLPDRYRSTAPSDRFRPPQPAPLAPYDLARSARARYPDPYDDYAPSRGYGRDRRHASDISTRYESPEVGEYSGSDLDNDRKPRRKKSSKNRHRSKYDGDDYYYEEEDDNDVTTERRSKKGQPSKSKKKSKDSRKSSRAKKRAEDEESEDEEIEESPTSSYDSEEEYERKVQEKKRSKRKGKSDKRGEREVDSVKSLEDETVPSTPVPQHTKGEFDLMSDWMGDSKDTDGSQGVPPAVGVVSPTPGSIPAAMQQAYQTAQMPMMPQIPMSMYNSVMPLLGAGFMPMMPHGFVPGIPPVMPAAMSGMPGTPGVTGTNTPGIPALINGMHNVNLNQQTPVSTGDAAAPPPPPMGAPAGPPPGPPPEPPQE